MYSSSGWYISYCNRKSAVQNGHQLVSELRGVRVMNYTYVEIKCQLDATDDFYYRSYCLLNMFRAPLFPSSGAREYYTDVCCLWYLVLWFSSCRYDVELRVMSPVCGLPDHTDNLKTKAPNTTGSNRLYTTLELLMMGIMVPETC